MLKEAAPASIGSNFCCATGTGTEGMDAGNFRKKASFSEESFTARFSRKEIISTSLFFNALDSASLEVFRRLVIAEASKR